MLTTRVAPLGRKPMLDLRAAGFIATRTFGASPGVEMSWSEMWTWNAETPARVPAGARISAGKSGNVALLGNDLATFPDLGREVRKRRQVIAEQGARRGEPVAGELHAVARVAGEPDDHLVELLGHVLCSCCHGIWPFLGTRRAHASRERSTPRTTAPAGRTRYSTHEICVSKTSIPPVEGPLGTRA